MSTLQERQDEVSDVSIGQLIFQDASHGGPKDKNLSIGVGDILADGSVEQTMKGATQLTLSMVDRDLEALQSGLFGERVKLALDGVPFRLTEISLVDTDLLQAVFEHELIAEMREHTKPMHAKRGTVTRAQFILMMLKELSTPYVYVSPELTKAQPVEKKKPTKPSLASVGRNSGLAKGSLTVKHVPVSAPQLAVLTQALSAASGTPGPTTLSLEALVVALIQENTVSNPDPGEPGDRGCLSMIDSTVKGIQKQDGKGTINPYDIAEVCEHFMEAGFYGQGGANALARAHPGWSPGQVAQACQGSAFPTAYDQWKAEAKNIVKAFGSEDGSFTVGTASATAGGTAIYEFTRGQPGKPEDSYTAALRLANEVLWRFFVVGRKSGKQAVYFADDDRLIKAAPRYLIDPQTVGVKKLTFDCEVGGRTVVHRGIRQPKPSEAQLTVMMDRWDAPPGCVIELADYGPGDGKWLVDSMNRPLFSAEGTVNLRAKQKALPEPRATKILKVAGSSKDSGGTGSYAVPGTLVAKLAKEHPELQGGVREIVAIILANFPTLQITSTTGGHHAQHSLHYEGRAADLAGPNMDAIGSWIQANLVGRLTEGIHNPTLSVKDGKAVSDSIWGAAVWAEHLDHIHVGR